MGNLSVILQIADDEDTVRQYHVTGCVPFFFFRRIQAIIADTIRAHAVRKRTEQYVFRFI